MIERFDLSGANLQLLETFFEVFETGGFTDATARLGIGRSTCAKRINALEEKLDTALFNYDGSHRPTRPNISGYDLATAFMPSYDKYCKALYGSAIIPSEHSPCFSPFIGKGATPTRIDFEIIEVFIGIIEMESRTLVASTKDILLPTLVYRMKSLEKLFGGAPIFTRTKGTKKWALTAHGEQIAEIIYPAFSDMLSGMQQGRKASNGAEMKGAIRGSIKLYMSSFAYSLVGPLWSQMTWEGYPGTRVELYRVEEYSPDDSLAFIVTSDLDGLRDQMSSFMLLESPMVLAYPRELHDQRVNLSTFLNNYSFGYVRGMGAYESMLGGPLEKLTRLYNHPFGLWGILSDADNRFPVLIPQVLAENLVAFEYLPLHAQMNVDPVRFSLCWSSSRDSDSSSAWVRSQLTAYFRHMAYK